ncbi:hypothetical protein HDV00_010694 [Rhizophlyctis rosea]|nr:hypothetical protein HDV00_010694 [Rhizophlyctis rosea]
MANQQKQSRRGKKTSAQRAAKQQRVRKLQALQEQDSPDAPDNPTEPPTPPHEQQASSSAHPPARATQPAASSSSKSRLEVLREKGLLYNPNGPKPTYVNFFYANPRSPWRTEWVNDPEKEHWNYRLPAELVRLEPYITERRYHNTFRYSRVPTFSTATVDRPFVPPPQLNPTPTPVALLPPPHWNTDEPLPPGLAPTQPIPPPQLLHIPTLPVPVAVPGPTPLHIPTLAYNPQQTGIPSFPYPQASYIPTATATPIQYAHPPQHQPPQH